MPPDTAMFPPSSHHLHACRKYFASGWAFLVPYVALYLGWLALGWPVKPGTTLHGIALVHVYWVLHALHVAALALLFRPCPALVPTCRVQSRLTFGYWLCFALLVGLPGLYLEYPADVWEHYARINEWEWHETVAQHSVYHKTTYFLAYSLVGCISDPVTQLRWLAVFQTGCCLLLGWQLLRLARAAGVSESWARLFVLGQPLLLGNNLFSFHRYYGLSSSIFGQIAAVALVHAALVTLRDLRCGAPNARNIARGLVAITLLAGLAASSHIQALGIALFGVLGVVAWRLIEWRRSMIAWLAVAAVVMSVAIVFAWPRHSTIDRVYLPEGWLMPWYGFNLFTPSSPALLRVTAVIGVFGWANVAAALLLLRRNRAIAWLTLAPLAALCVPAIALPLADSLARRGVANIITFNRFLLAVPAGLALVACGEEWLTKCCERRTSWVTGAPVLAAAGLFVLMTLPASAPYYNRTWHALAQFPNDLQAMPLAQRGPGDHRLMSTPAFRYVAGALPRATDDDNRRTLFLDSEWIRRRHPWPVPADDLGPLLRQLAAAATVEADLVLRLPQPEQLTTSGSTAGRLSGHWQPYAVALEHAGTAELEREARRLGARATAQSGDLLLGAPQREK